MEDIGDYIYFLLLAVFALSGLFGKKKKDTKTSEKKKPVFDQIPKSWEELEEMMDKPQPKPQPATTVRPVTIPRSEPARPSTPFGTAEVISSPEYETTGYETMSYDTATDFSTLRAKKQIKESIFKTKTTFVDTLSESESATEFSPFTIDLANTEEAQKAFIYSEIFQRKYR